MKNVFLRAVVCPFTNGQTCKRTNNLPIDTNLSFCLFTIEKIPALCQVYGACKGTDYLSKDSLSLFSQIYQYVKGQKEAVKIPAIMKLSGKK